MATRYPSPPAGRPWWYFDAGNTFCSLVLFGLARGRDLETCARIGCICAREVITHIGPRPEADMQALLRAEGLL